MDEAKCAVCGCFFSPPRCAEHHFLTEAHARLLERAQKAESRVKYLEDGIQECIANYDGLGLCFQLQRLVDDMTDDDKFSPSEFAQRARETGSEGFAALVPDEPQDWKVQYRAHLEAVLHGMTVRSDSASWIISDDLIRWARTKLGFKDGLFALPEGVPENVPSFADFFPLIMALMVKLPLEVKTTREYEDLANALNGLTGPIGEVKAQEDDKEWLRSWAVKILEEIGAGWNPSARSEEYWYLEDVKKVMGILELFADTVPPAYRNRLLKSD